ncbi:hypothetical protein [Anaerosalibacter sp. Marseille-P3206]|uniref:hypothetical protein n=1 Tax=Anaerosalibacter sp. Marseille-P3206 TaxID=1871005 RepID=UPI000986EF43|nr:hypothetical protein [Anaerosalibacter sp. Marseille-P3206]
MFRKNITLIVAGLLLATTLTACSPKTNVNKAEAEKIEESVKTNKEVEEKNTNEENRGKKVAIEEIKNYFDVDIDSTYELKANYYDYGDDSKYHQYLFWNDSSTFDIRVSEKEDNAFYLKQILPEKNNGKSLNKDEAEALSKEFIKDKLGDKANKLVLVDTSYEVEKNTDNIEFYVFEYNLKDNESSGVFIKVDCYNNYITEITLFN